MKSTILTWIRHLFRRSLSPEQIEIKRLRRVLHDIAGSRPDQYMDIEKNPELVNWICDTCHKASVGAYPCIKSSALTLKAQ